MSKTLRLPDDEAMLRLIDQIYDAAMSPSEWPHTLASIAEQFHCPIVDILGQDKRSGEALFAITHNAEHLIPDYSAHYVYINPRLAHGKAHPELPVTYDYMHSSDAEMDRSEFYNWLEREGDVRYTVSARIQDCPSALVSASLNFGKRQGHPDTPIIKRLQALQPHLRRAVGVTRRLEAEQLGTQALGEAVDALSTGVLLLDHEGKTAHVNRAAQQMLAAQDGLTAIRGALRATKPADNRKLWQAIAAASASPLPEAHQGRATVSITRPSGAPPYEILIAPVGRQAGFAFAGEVRTLLLISVPQAPAPPSREILQSHYDLTPAEVRLCEAMRDGAETSALADRLGVSVGTVRTRLKQVMAKTDTHRRAELVALLGALRPRLSSGES